MTKSRFYEKLADADIDKLDREALREIIRQQEKIIQQQEVHLENIQKLKKFSDNHYREFFEGSRDGLVMVDISGRIIDCNPSFCEILGYASSELKQLSNFYDFTPKKWHKWENDEIWQKRLLGNGYSGLYEKEYIRKDGSVILVELKAYAVRDRKGFLDYVWGVVRPVSKKNENQL